MEQLKVLILLARPASGKSEVRRFLRHLGAEVCRRDFGLGPVIELDDYPYVHMMRLIDEALARNGKEPMFFEATDRPFRDPKSWLVLIDRLNDDYERLGTGWKSSSQSKARSLFRWLDRNIFNYPNLATLLQNELETRAGEVISALETESAKPMDGATVVMEFARGGPVRAVMPLPSPLGYYHSLAALSPEILWKASILYVDVSPEQARQKNRDRRPPPGFTGDVGTYHFVPEAVMDYDYGCDDIGYLLSVSDRPNTVRIDVAGQTYYLPCALFNNRDKDLTSFVRRGQPNEWDCEDISALHAELKRTFNVLAAAQANR